MFNAGSYEALMTIFSMLTSLASIYSAYNLQVSRSRELRLVQNYALLIDPEVKYYAQELKIE